jgi:hypothetical protein
MLEIRFIWALAVAVGGMAALAMAETPESRVLGRHDTPVVTRHRVLTTASPHTRLVLRRVVEPAAVVGRDLAEQPVRTDLVELQVVNTTIYLDPDADYEHQGVNPIDEDHRILKAQRLARSLLARPARVLRNPLADRPAEAAAKPLPHAIIRFRKPDLDNGPEHEPEAPAKGHPQVAKAR